MLNLDHLIEETRKKYSQAEWDSQFAPEDETARPAFTTKQGLAFRSTSHKLTRAIVNKFVYWSKSKHNDYKKSEVVQIIMEAITARTNGLRIFHSGSYCPCSNMTSNGTYILDGQAGYLANGWYEYSTNTFWQVERITFSVSK